MKLCKVCFSEHGEEFDRMRQEGKTLKELAEYSEEVGENISLPAFSRHYRNNHGGDYRREVVNDWIGGLFKFREEVEAKVNVLDGILSRRNDPKLEGLKGSLEESESRIREVTDAWLENNLGGE